MRIFFVHHVTWSVNRYATISVRVGLTPMTIHRLRRREIDPSALIIGAMEKLGLAWNVVRISPERQAQRAA